MNANIRSMRRPAGPLRGKFTRERWDRMLARLNGGDEHPHRAQLAAGIAETRRLLARR